MECCLRVSQVLRKGLHQMLHMCFACIEQGCKNKSRMKYIYIRMDSSRILRAIFLFTNDADEENEEQSC